jgi:hypothetical protein
MTEDHTKINAVLDSLGIQIEARRPYDDNEPDGYLESDNDFVQNNIEVAVKLMDEGGLQSFAKAVLSEALKALESQENTGVNAEAARAIFEQRFGIDFFTDTKQTPSPSI